MSNFIAIYDSCVLYPASLRDLLMHLALTNLFRAKWTNEIHEEWMRNVLSNRSDLTLEQLNRTKSLMNAHVRDCLVEEYHDLITALVLPDPHDRHVLAASIRCSASIIVTYNLKDFPKKALEKYGVEAQHPDDFVLHLIDLSPITICKAIRRLRASLKKPPIDVKGYLQILEKQALVRTVIKLREYLDFL